MLYLSLSDNFLVPTETHLHHSFHPTVKTNSEEWRRGTVRARAKTAMVSVTAEEFHSVFTILLLISTTTITATNSATITMRIAASTAPAVPSPSHGNGNGDGNSKDGRRLNNRVTI